MKIERISAPPVVQPPDTIVLTLTQEELNELTCALGVSCRRDRLALATKYGWALSEDHIGWCDTLRNNCK